VSEIAHHLQLTAQTVQFSQTQDVPISSPSLEELADNTFNQVANKDVPHLHHHLNQFMLHHLNQFMLLLLNQFMLLLLNQSILLHQHQSMLLHQLKFMFHNQHLSFLNNQHQFFSNQHQFFSNQLNQLLTLPPLTLFNNLDQPLIQPPTPSNKFQTELLTPPLFNKLDQLPWTPPLLIPQLFNKHQPEPLTPPLLIPQL
jgi:hypothetical protein